MSHAFRNWLLSANLKEIKLGNTITKQNYIKGFRNITIKNKPAIIR